jgi:hypothetical protein
MSKRHARVFVKVGDSDWSEAKGKTTQINIQAEDPGARAPERSDEDIKLEQLTKLSDLHVSGALTDQEFVAAKAKLLAG